MTRGDDTSNLVVNLPFTMNWMGTPYTQVYLNMNGNITFSAGNVDYTPNALSGLGQAMMAPYWADVDSRYVGAPNQLYYSNLTSGSVPTVDGHKAVLMTWSNVMRYNGGTQSQDTTNTFQLVLIDRSDTGAGNFDFEYNYDKVVWDTGTASTGYPARMGWATATGQSYETPGSGTTGALLDSGAAGTSLIKNSLNSGGQLGRYVWQVRAGGTPNAAPVVTVTNRTLEGNIANGYASYTASGDVTATDVDGSIVSFTSTPSLPATFTLGTRSLLWTAVDNRGAVTTATQSVTVTDTTAPALPTVSSSSHTAGVWTTNPTATVNWTTATDVCTGLYGYSVSWSQNATALPDATRDASASVNTSTTSLADGSWYFNVRTVDNAGNWSPTAASFGPINVDRVKPTTTSNAPSSWASATVNVTLTATDPSGPVAYTRYKLDAAATATYTVPVAVSGDGTHTLLFWSVDSAGNVETTQSATIRIDTGAPSTPSGVLGSAPTTTSALLTWSASSDALSGVSYYAIYRGGSQIATTAATTYTDTGLTSNTTYTYYVVAVDAAGNRSANSTTVNVTTPNARPIITITNPTLEGNVANGYASYTASGDVTAIDPDGSIASFVSSPTLPAMMPVGTTAILWTATDNRGGVTTATQSVTVTDTTPPTPTAAVWSTTHTTGVWSSNPTVTVNWLTATDICTGLKGYSVSWSPNAPALPDATRDAAASANTTTSTTTIDSESFATATWPSDMTRNDATYVRLTNAAGRNHGTYAAEAWDNGTTRRNLNFYRDYDLTHLTTATLTFWDNVSAFAGGGDYSRVEYSTDGGTTYTQLQNVTAASAWNQHSYNLPVGGTVRVRFSASINAAGEYSDWDDIAVTGFATTDSMTSTPGDGTWYFNVRTVDNAGNWSPTAVSVGPIQIDTVKPTTTSNVPSSWASATVNVTLTATDPSGPVAYTRYKLDAAATATYTVPVAVSGDGTHTLLFWSADLAGNVETTKSATVLVDTAAPSVPTSVGASALTTTSVRVTWNASTDAASGVSYYAIYRNGSQIATTSATTYTDVGLSPSTTYTYYVVAVDAAGNRSANSANANGTTPNAPPVVTVTNRTLEGNVANAYASYTASGDVTASDPDGSIVSFVSSPTLPATLTVGTRNILWTATDNKGAVTTATQSVTVADSTPPTLPTLSSPTHTASVWSSNPTVTVNWTTATDVCTGLSGYSVSWSPNAAALPDTTKDASASVNTSTTKLADGVWYFNVRTVDNAGNWSASSSSFGPVRIDTVSPTTTSDAPSSWASSTVNVTLTATDPSGPIAYTRYKLDSSAVSTYTAPVAISSDGVHTLLFWSADSAGNVEATQSATIQIDSTAPSTPTSIVASAVSTTSVELTWNAATDALSGISYYAIYRNGTLITTTAGTTYTDTGLVAGSVYPYYVVAVDAGGNCSGNSATANGTLPSSEIWMSLTADSVNMGGVSPGLASTLTSATTVKVGGVGLLNYDLSCSANDFSNSATGSVTPTMPVSMLSYTTSGYTSVPLQTFVNAPHVIDTSVGVKYMWEHDYTFDYVLNVPWAFDPGTYTTTITYTVVSR